MTTENFTYFKDYVLSEDEIINGDKFLKIVDNSKLSYIKTDFFVLNHQFNWRGSIHPTVFTKFIISGHSDYEINKYIYDMHGHNFTLWFASNKNYHAENLKTVPIGITNYCNDSPQHLIFGNTQIMMDVLKENDGKKEFKNLVYMNFAIYTSPQERQKVFNMFSNKKYVTVDSMDISLQGRKKFLSQLHSHKFCLCPRGNGIDTHRLWESLYMGTIPIVRREIMFEEFQDLPILFIDSWDEISEEFLEKKYDEIHSKKWNMDKLNFSFWKKYILDLCK